MAGPTISLRTNVTDKEVAHYMEKARGFIFPGLDDFGITPLEAMAAGTPVIAYQGGGALDYVVPGVTGEFFTSPDAASLAEVLKDFNPQKYISKKIVAKATTFSPQVFQQRMEETILKSLPNAS
jgi:glycosyltransferase involved in cell wall biosynthesis